MDVFFINFHGKGTCHFSSITWSGGTVGINFSVFQAGLQPEEASEQETDAGMESEGPVLNVG